MASFNRKSERFPVLTRIELVKERTLVAIGTVIDLSRDGVGFKSAIQLSVGQTYFAAVRGFVNCPLFIVHRHNIDEYGGRFTLSDSSKDYLEQRIRESLDASWKAS